MATFDQLPAEQRAVIELVLGRGGRSYDTLADMLGATPSRVRELAREALTELSPTTAGRVDPEWRAQLADYVLGQQSGPESTATQGHLKRSEAARVWTYSLIDSLDHLYGNGARPTIPSGEDGAAAPSRRERERERVRAAMPEPKPRRDAPARPAAAKEPLSAEARAIVRRRRLVGGAIGLVVVGGIIALIVALTSGGGGDNNSKGKTTKASNQQVRVLGELVLSGSANGKGVAVIAQRGTQRQLIVEASLPQSKQGEAYVVWLMNSPQDAVSVGAQVADNKNRFQGAGPLPANYQRYKFIDVTRQKITANTTYGGTSVLRGSLNNLVTPQQAQQQGAPAAPGAGQGGTGTGTGTGTTP